MKIKVHEGSSTYPRPDTFTRDSEKFINLLEVDEEFIKLLAIIRESLGFPEEGFPSIVEYQLWERKQYKEKGIDFLSKQSDLIDQFSVLLKSLFMLPNGWENFFHSIIIDNTSFYPYLDLLPIETIFRDGEVQIIIREKMSLRNVQKFIREDHKRIGKYLETLSESPRIKIEGIEVKKYMLKLQIQGASLVEIAEKVEKRYKGKLSFSPDYEIIGSLISRFKKDIKRTLHKNWSKTVPAILALISSSK
ncbi:MAG TPA: hypothetical protein VLB73_02760 [Patescibacteria group bacterium]|nr:hypothetical protein [Patescibacteria group bacterium]